MLSPSERALRARAAAHALHAQGGTSTKAGTAAFLARFEKQESPLSPLASLRALEEAVVQHVTVVVLDVANLDDAFLLFETLNDRGLSLSAADLVKSHLLSQLEHGSPGISAMTLHGAADAWDDTVNGLGGGDISGFLRHYLLMRHEQVRKADVFTPFKKDVAAGPPRSVLDDLARMGGHYAEFRNPPSDDPIVGEVLSNLAVTGIDVHRMALMPARAFASPARFAEFARACEFLSCRWIIAGLNAQELETIYQRAAAQILGTEGTEIENAEARLWDAMPSDAAFGEAFARRTLGVQFLAAYALRRIENVLDGGEKHIKSSTSVHLEHIMPRTATPFWIERETEEAAYEEVVERWGNLTLLLARLNIQVSNGDWSTKRHGTNSHKGYSDSKVILTSQLAQLEDWTSNDIKLRGRWLATLATRVWNRGRSVDDVPDYPTVRADPSLLPPL